LFSKYVSCSNLYSFSKRSYNLASIFEMTFSSCFKQKLCGLIKHGFVFCALFLYCTMGGFKVQNMKFHLKDTVRSESRCALIKGFGSDVHERRYRPESVYFYYPKYTATFRTDCIRAADRCTRTGQIKICSAIIVLLPY
jgi:hypothetical protein